MQSTYITTFSWFHIGSKQRFYCGCYINTSVQFIFKSALFELKLNFLSPSLKDKHWLIVRCQMGNGIVFLQNF